MTTHLIIWGTVFAIMVIAELSTLQLVSIWFAAGAAGAFITALFGGPMWLQLIIFTIFSLVLLVFTRPLLRRIMKQGTSPTNTDRDIGKKAVVIDEINNNADRGRVKLEGVDWKAVSVDGRVVPRGTVVRVENVEGSKLLVSACEKK